MSDDAHAPQSSSLPTHHDDGSSGEHKDAPPSSFPSLAEFRFLIDNASVGGLIGKGGANVKRVREDSGAFVSILKSESRTVQERIMLIKGTTEQIAKAALLIAELSAPAAAPLCPCSVSFAHAAGCVLRCSAACACSLIEASAGKDRPAAGSGGAVVPSEQAQLRLLVHKMAVGAVIGKAGAVIKETQQETGARVQVSNEPLPNSSEKTVTITGSPTAVQDAISRVVQQLRDSPLKPGTRSYEYNPNNPYGSGGQQSHFSSSHSQFPPASHHGGPLPVSMQAGSGSGSGSGSTAAGSSASTQKIAIPTVCAGCVIGKNGSVIRDLRAQSGTNISISDPEPSAPNERVVTLTGSAQGIQTAVYLIRQLVEQYQPQGSSQQGY